MGHPGKASEDRFSSEDKRGKIMKGQKAWKVPAAAMWFFVVILVLSCAGQARCEYPERPITIVVGMDAGGTLDLITRALAGGAGAYLKQPILIENKGGAGGAVAVGSAVGAAPDGYTLASVPHAAIVDIALMQKLAFKPLRSISPITAFTCSEHTGLLVNQDAPWKTFQEFVAYAKQHPGKIKYGHAGIGSGMHLAMEVVAQKEGIKWVSVPYKGTPAARVALMGKHIDACSHGVGLPAVAKNGDLRLLVTHGEKRAPDFPDIPTLIELGYEYINRTYHSIVGPAGLPPELVTKLETAFARGMETPEFKTTQEKLYFSPGYYNAKDYQAFLKEKWVTTEKLFKRLGIIQESATQPY
jgi:tripartite-type tricarboxylate transporter receptor subunit TctC